MIVIAAMILGAVIGWTRAARLGGNTRDRLQYAAAHGLAFTILGLFATLLIGRLV